MVKFTWQQIADTIKKARAQNKTDAQIQTWLSKMWLDAGAIKTYLSQTKNTPAPASSEPSPTAQMEPPTGDMQPQTWGINQPWGISDIQAISSTTPTPTPASPTVEDTYRSQFGADQQNQITDIINKARDQGISQEDIQFHLTNLLDKQKEKPQQRAEQIKAQNDWKAIDAWLAFVWDSEDTIFQMFASNQSPVNNNTPEYRAAYTRYQNFQTYTNASPSQIADQLYQWQLTIGSKVWNDLLAAGQGQKLQEAQTLANVNLGTSASNNLLGGIMSFDPNKTASWQMTTNFFQIPDYLQTLSDRVVSLLTDPEQAVSLSGALAESEDVQNQKKQIIKTQKEFDDLNDQMKNLEDDIKAMMIDRGLSPNSSILAAMVLEKSKPLTRQLEYLQNQYSNQTSTLALLTDQVTAQRESNQALNKQQLQATEFLFNQAKDIYNTQLNYYMQIAGEDRAYARELALEEAKAKMAAENPEVKFIPADKYGGDRFFNPVTQQVTYLNGWPRWGGGWGTWVWWATNVPKENKPLVDLLLKYKNILDTTSFASLQTSPSTKAQANSLLSQITAEYKQAKKLGTLDTWVQRLIDWLVGKAGIWSLSTYSNAAQSQAVMSFLENLWYTQSPSGTTDAATAPQWPSSWLSLLDLF